MGYLFVNVQLPDAASTERTAAVLRKLEKIAVQHARRAARLGHRGQSFALNAIGSNFGTMFINLKPYHERRDPDLIEHGDSGKTAREPSPAFRMPGSRSFRRRRCAAWAGRAASPW